MPTYSFQCHSCGLQFDASIPLVKRNDPRKCECGVVAERLPPTTVSGHFKKDVTGPVPQNTGIAGLDSHIDRVIGQSAAQGREVIHERVQDKQQVLDDNPGSTGHDLSKNADGSYRVLGSDERAAHERSQAIHSGQADWRKKLKDERKSR